MNDERLRSEFQVLRDAERAGAPAFSSVLGAARRSRRPLPLRHLAIATTSIAAAAALWLVNPEHPRPFTMSDITAWRPATDVLLPAPIAGALGDMTSLSASTLDSFLPPVTDSSERTLP